MNFLYKFIFTNFVELNLFFLNFKNKNIPSFIKKNFNFF